MNIIDDWLEKHGDPAIDEQVKEKVKLLNQQHMSQQPFDSRTSDYEQEVVRIKLLRQDTDAIIQRVKELPASRETSITITKLQEGVMWLGMRLKSLGEANPYPSSKDPSTGTKIEPTADGLKL